MSAMPSSLFGGPISGSDPVGIFGDSESYSVYDPFSNTFMNNSAVNVPEGNQGYDVQYFGSSAPPNPSPQNSNPMGWLSGVGDAFSKIAMAGINAASSGIANKISANPTFSGNVAGKSTTGTAGTILGISAGTLLLIGGGILLIVLMKKRG